MCICVVVYATQMITDMVRPTEKKDSPVDKLPKSSHYTAVKIGKPEFVTFIAWDFETGWQGWTHTNGQMLPAAWAVQPSDLHGAYRPPDAGDSSMWIDSDAAGSGIWVQDTTLSPVIVPPINIAWLKYGVGYNWITSGEWLEVGLKYFDGTNWNITPIKLYESLTNDVGPRCDSVDISMCSRYDSIQVYFYYDDDDSWAYYVGIDNVTIDITPIVYFWDFETGLQGWYHTNGQPFPAGWDVEPSNYKPSWAPPDAGDSCMWIDSDEAGSGIWVQDTTLSPGVVPNFAWLKYGLGYNWIASGEWVEVGVKYFDGSVGTVVPLMIYNTGDFGPAWDSVDVSAYNGYDSIQIYFYYDDNNNWAWYAAFDNVGLYLPPTHDVGCTAVISPPAGSVTSGDYDVIGRIQNFGSNIETFDVTANVYDTVGMIPIFTATVTMTDFPVGGDTNVTFGTVTFEPDKYYITEIYTQLNGDENPLNDTSSVYSWALFGPPLIFEMDVEAITGDYRLLGVEFDGEYFYCTGATDMTQTKLYVIDTAGSLLHTFNQPAHSTGWGWRDLCWDHVYRGPDRIDTLYASVDGNVDKFSVDFAGDSLIYWGYFDGPENPNRALAYNGYDNWFFTANFSSNLYKFNKDTLIIQTVGNTWAMYGAAYDDQMDWVWWHSQDDPGTGYNLMIHQMDPNTMVFTGVILGPVPTMSPTGVAGGLSFYSGFFGNYGYVSMLFGMNQGTPDHIFGVFLLPWSPIEDKLGVEELTAFGFALNMPNPIKGHTSISYATPAPGKVCVKIYDNAGRLIRALVNQYEPAGTKTVYWDGKDDNSHTVANGIYFLRLDTAEKSATQKLILIK